MKVIHVRLTDQLVDTIKARADASGISIAEQARRIMKDGLAEEARVNLDSNLKAFQEPAHER